MSYNKTIWHARDIITATKMQKIEDQLEALSESAGMNIHICASNEYNTISHMPVIGIPSTNTIYLVPDGNNSNNLYVEWVYVNNAWEKFGAGITSFNETDPTVPAWAKAAQKPTYTIDEICDVATLEETRMIITAYDEKQEDDSMLIETEWYADPNDQYTKGWMTEDTADEIITYIKAGKQLIFHCPAAPEGWGFSTDSYISLGGFAEADIENEQAANFSIISGGGDYSAARIAEIQQVVIDETTNRLLLKIYVD